MYAIDGWRYDRYLDDRAEYSRDQWDDDHAPDMGCEECGATWYSGWTRGSLVDPPEPHHPDCPECARASR